MVVDLATAPEVTVEQAAPRPPLRFRAARVLLVVLLVTVVAVVAAGVYDDTANALIAGHLGVVAGAFLAGLLAVVALRAPLRRPGAARPDVHPDADHDSGADEDSAAWEPEAIEPKAIVAGTHATGSPGEPEDDSAPSPAEAAARADDPSRDLDPDPAISPQALLLQVRTLEATLAEEDLRLGRVRREAARKADEQVRREHDRVRVTLRVMRAVVADVPGQAAVARMETALDRLAVDDGFVRPQLSPVSTGTWPVVFAPPAPLAALAAAAADLAGAADPATEDLPGSAGSPVDEAARPAPAGPAKVLPVPPPPAPLVPTRKSRRARRAAGV